MTTPISRQEHVLNKEDIADRRELSHDDAESYAALVDAWESVMRRFANMKCMDIDPIDGPCGFTCPPCRARKLMKEYDG